MEFMVVVILSFLLCICNGNGPSTQSSEKAEKKESRSIQSDINVLKDSMHELLKRVIKHENEISSLKSENQFLTNKIENERRQLSCDINVLHENTNEQQQALTDTNTEIIYLNETVEELRNGVDKLEELQRRRSEDNITECIDKPDTESNQERKNRDCTDIQKNSNQALESGVYTIYPNGGKSVQAYCDMSTDGGGWTVIQKRFDGSVDFNQNWLECENGFGNINGEFWFGNNYVHTLTASGKNELRIDMVDTSNNKKYAVYRIFSIGDAASKYKLTVGNYSGNAGVRVEIS
ncbi:Hypothetical predicted protein [Mytilus galloprovincialis]|uniref:Fibrinogen C-terminal domain-containing protein n=1 Tax=Mytilus galloprovincialis TaxID=29158 RepID=A0A8B6F765_MYTGA|nr:Hypothetical predicted protein [Mytilus galloprovincialis]